LFVVEPGSKVIDIDIVDTSILIVRAEDLAAELLLESFFATLGFEALAASRRLGVRTEVLPGWTVTFGRPRIGEIGRRRSHGRPGWSWTERRAKPAATCRTRSGLPGASLVHSESPAFEGLIVKLADCFLGLLRVRELHKSKSTFSSSLAVEWNGHIREIPDR